jgi:signal transduction histidine kinase/ActR/RegA family two-component response regulator
MRSLSRPSYLHALLLAGLTVVVMALGWIVGRDLRQAPEAASLLYTRLAQGLDLVDELEFTTQEVRRILLYALHTSDANLQLEYAEQSRAAAGRVERLLAPSVAAASVPSGTRAEIERARNAWRQYVIVRDDVIGLILEGSLREGVILDQELGTARFNEVRAAVAALKTRLESDAAVQVAEARAHADRTMRRLLVLVVSALIAAVAGIYVVNRRAALEAVQAELRRARDAAEAATAAKSDFLATMSHELRTPLTGVVGIADLLHAEDLSHRQRDLVRMLRSSAAALLHLVSDILDYSRIEAGLMDVTPSTWVVTECIEDAFDSVTESASRKGLDVGYIVDPGVPPAVTADRERVAQVLLNLLSNAVKFTEAGEVSVHVGATPLPDERVEMRVAVRDTGPGIPGHLHEQLFKRFTQLDAGAARRHGGTGLGLAISERLARLLGGSLRVESAVGRGTTFTFSFIATPASTPTASAVRLFDGARVLLRAAPGIVGEQLRSVLSGWGVEVCDSSPDHEAPSHGSYDAIVIDGDAAAGETHGAVSPIPVVAIGRMGAVPPAELDSQIRTLGKPVRARALEEALRCALGSGAPPTAVQSTPPSAPFAHQPASILLVEDNAANRRVMQMMLEELGVSGVDEATDGSQAVARARERDYDIILMDLQMPRLDGFEATRRIRADERRQRPRIIALTANVVQGEQGRCVEAGMDGYLSKPIRLDALDVALRSFAPGNL